MKRQLPSNIIFIMESLKHPFLPELIRELEAMGIIVCTTEKQGFKALTPGLNDYIVTDMKEGAEVARKNKTGYCAFVQDEPSKTEFWDAECIIQGFDEVDADFIVKMYERSKHIPWIILETPRTVVRELVIDDIDDMYDLYAEPGLSDFIPKLCESKDEEIEFEQMYIKSMYEFYGYGIWTVLDKETGKFIGRAGLANRDGFEDMEVGYMLSNKYQHKGIAAEVMEAIIAYAAKKFGCERLNAFIDDDNITSIRFAEKLGFKKTGMARIEDKFLGWYILKI